MKDQYFGDINDYRKYGLLRCIIEACNFRILVAWMLTRNDGRSDGKFIEYLNQPAQWSGYDQILFYGLREPLKSGAERKVRLIEKTKLIPNARFFSDEIHDSASRREAWFSLLSEKAKDCDFIFLDPDNGLEVKSKRYGRKNSSKYLYWREVEALWNSGKSLLIYQHFTREKRTAFKQRLLKKIKEHTPNSALDAFSTPYVVFFIALQPAHKKHLPHIRALAQERWGDQIAPFTEQ
jgi:hypothetical protein